MAEIPNLPSGAVPPKSNEPVKVQPKKETVRINLPPKPTASPTIKLPTLPTGSPAPLTASAAAPAAPSAPGTGPKPPTPPTGGTGVRVAPATAQRAAMSPSVPAPRQAPAPVSTVSGLDRALAIIAAIASIAALGMVIFLAFVFNTHPGS